VPGADVVRVAIEAYAKVQVDDLSALLSDSSPDAPQQALVLIDEFGAAVDANANPDAQSSLHRPAHATAKSSGPEITRYPELPAVTVP
jgi:hypothetical protein